jgi:hypothetical protein
MDVILFLIFRFSLIIRDIITTSNYLVQGQRVDKKCVWCGRELAPDNVGKICLVCADELKNVAADLPETLDVEDVRKLLHLESAETVRRKHRKGELPPCIPGQKKLLWFKKDIMDYLKFGKSYQTVSSEEMQAIAIALKLGWPIERYTSYGHDPQNLIDSLKRFGYLKDKENPPNNGRS